MRHLNRLNGKTGLLLAAALTCLAATAPAVRAAVPTITSFSPTQARPGSTISISGTSLFAATAVTFNGQSASFTRGTQFILSAVVPAGASTGPISVTTSSGTATSASNFTPLYVVSGKVAASGVALSGVSVVCSGSGTPATTDSGGNYSFTLAPGSYTLTPSMADYTFTPTTRNATLVNADVSGANFNATAVYNIAGRIATSSGTGLANVQVTRTLSGTPVFTNGAGYFTFAGVPNGTYQITPSLSPYSFSPGYQTATVAGANLANINFTGGYAISGRIYSSTGTGTVGVSVALSGNPHPTTTNGAGYYMFYGVAPGSYTITPTLLGYGFAPQSLNVTISTASVAGQNFIASSGYRVLGRITQSGGTPLANVSVARTGSATPAVSNSAGYFTFNGVPDGSHTLTPTLAGKTFSPVTKSVIVSGADAVGQNFIGS